MQALGPASFEGRHVVFFNWRDTKNPEGGGSERYVETMARGLVDHGARVSIFCAAHDQAPSDHVVDGVRYMRRGNHLEIYLFGLWALLRRRFGRIDLVVDVQNGLPFFTRLGTRKPVVVLVHHVHREQWPVIFPGLLGKIGWWIERRVAPFLYRRSQYIAVSRATRNELIDLGVSKSRIAVVHNGTATPPVTHVAKTEHPSLVVVSRLVPHKQIEHAIDAVAALREGHPDVRLSIVGTGWWEDDLYKYAAEAGVGDVVTFEGFVSEQRKHEILARSWVMLLPSIKEGWGLVIGEAGSHGVPTVAYASAGGTRESIAHQRSGLLVLDAAEMTEATRRLLEDSELRERLGAGALEMSRTFSWAHSRESFAHVLSDVLAGRRVQVEDPDGP
ncbi:glycosyltransferase family 4 protein [Nocardioides panacihumi]|uniref:Glycosyltransferase family 4 protein n=1 Tax=Nocardioides panacihumi TaxID=400774 RepID=A0ABN2QZZ5_9ACTN